MNKENLRAYINKEVLKKFKILLIKHDLKLNKTLELLLSYYLEHPEKLSEITQGDKRPLASARSHEQK